MPLSDLFRSDDGSSVDSAHPDRERFNLNELALQDLQNEAEVILGDKLPQRVTEGYRKVWVDTWLRWSQRDDSETRRRWAYLAADRVPSTGAAKTSVDRDSFVLALWKTVTSGHPNSATKDFIQKRVPFDFYQSHFFGWFLSRFDLRAARGVFIDPTFATRLHAILILVTALTALLCLGVAKAQLVPSLLVFLCLLGFVAVAGGYAKKKGLPWYAYFNSLSPRLGAAVGIGYLFFFSAPHLIKILNDTPRLAWQFWLAVFTLVVMAFGYLTFHISRRVHPKLQTKDLFRRSGAILALAIAYSALELLVAGPMLFSQAFLEAAESSCPAHASLDRLAFCAAVALNLGVILQLAWDEKPLTEPL